jgi:2-keto-3-deoxy-L-rhamnonate aldolase RhmA
MGFAGLKEMARSRALKCGHFVVEFATPGIGHILKAAGCDFALLDTEHSGFHNETIKGALRYFEAGEPADDRARALEGVPPHRPRRRHGGRGRHAADGQRRGRGAGDPGLPEVRPDGKRGVALGIAHDRYTGGPVLAKLAAANERTTFFAQIETAAGVENADAIAALPGVDCLWVGHFDLSCSLGIPGQFDHPTFADAIRRVGDACRRHGKARAGSCRTSRPASTSTTRTASTSSATRATSGRCRRR